MEAKREAGETIMAATVEQLARQIKTLTQEKQAVLEHLLAQGTIVRIPDRYQKGYRPDPQAEGFTPVPVIGRSVSETLLEDRGPQA